LARVTNLVFARRIDNCANVRERIVVNAGKTSKGPYLCESRAAEKKKEKCEEAGC
jgi:hypothetical protein